MANEPRTPHTKELDVIRLTEDLPEYGLLKGDQGTVVEMFTNPAEAYMIEFQNSVSESVIADWVLPTQIQNLDALAQSLFEEGINCLRNGEIVEAVLAFQKALRLKPSLIRVLHNAFSQKFAAEEQWEALISHMQLLIEIDDEFELAKRNLAIGFLNLGVRMAHRQEFPTALGFFLKAFSMPASLEIIELLKQNITSTHVALGVADHKAGQLEEALRHMQEAYKFSPNELTRKNLGLAYMTCAEKALEKGDFRAAVTHYFNSEDTGLRTSEGLNNRAVAHLHLKEIDVAIRCLMSAVALDSQNQVAQNNLQLLLQNREALKAELLELARAERISADFVHLAPGNAAGISLVAAA